MSIIAIICMSDIIRVNREVLMNKFILFLSAICAFSAVYSHAPSRIDIMPDSTMQYFYVSVEHSVPMPSFHFIDIITVSINGKESVKQTFSSQLNKIEQKGAYFLPNLKQGDKITVTAYCNITGKLSTDYTVEFNKKEE